MPCDTFLRYNTENGGPALEKLTNAIFDGTKKLKQYFIADSELKLDYSKVGTTQYLVQVHGSSKFRPFTVQVWSNSACALLALRQPASTAQGHPALCAALGCRQCSRNRSCVAQHPVKVSKCDSLTFSANEDPLTYVLYTAHDVHSAVITDISPSSAALTVCQLLLSDIAASMQLCCQTVLLACSPAILPSPYIASAFTCLMQVIDPVEDYLKLLRTIFDFDGLKALLHKPNFKFTFDAMHGVSGPYAKRIFVQVCDLCYLCYNMYVL